MNRNTRMRMVVSLGFCAAASGAALLAGCDKGGLGKVGDLLGDKGGNTGRTGSGSDFDAGMKTIGGLKKAFVAEDVSPAEEYNYGRAACASLFGNPKTRLDRSNEALTQYVAGIGQTLAMVSDRADQYKGWHFAVLDSNDVNAFSAPGGYVVVTRGCIAACTDEDQLASVLAHEVAHVELGHPTRGLQDARKRAGWSEAAEGAGSSSFASRVPLADQLGKATDYLVENYQTGHGAKLEAAADQRGIDLLIRAGYNPRAMVAFFNGMKPKEKGGLLDQLAHPVSGHYQPGKRAAEADAYIKQWEAQGWKFEDNAARKARFDSIVKK